MRKRAQNFHYRRVSHFYLSKQWTGVGRCASPRSSGRKTCPCFFFSTLPRNPSKEEFAVSRVETHDPQTAPGCFETLGLRKWEVGKFCPTCAKPSACGPGALRRPRKKKGEEKRGAGKKPPTGVGKKKIIYIKAGAVVSRKTDYSAGKLYSRELIILKSKGPISWLTFMKELKLH